MVSASATFTVGNPNAQQPSIAPSIDNPVVNTNSSLNYPTYVPVSVPAPIPSKEAAITNVNMPQQVLPGSNFSIIVSVTTYIAGTVNYVCTLSIPQMQLQQTSMPMTLSNNAVGTTTFNVSLPITARGLTAAGTVTGQITLQDQTNNTTVDGVPISFTIGGTTTLTPVGAVPSPIQAVPLGPVARPVIGAVPLGPGAIPVRYGYQGYDDDYDDEGYALTERQKERLKEKCGPWDFLCIMRNAAIKTDVELGRNPNPPGPTFGYQGYVFGRGGGRQRHQWDFMPHTLNPRARYGYQGTLGVDYTLACSDQSVANGAGICANGTHAVVSPIAVAPTPPPVVAPAPVATVPTSTDTGLPAATTPPVPVATPVTPTVTPATPVATPVVTTPVPPVVVTPPTPPTPAPPVIPTPNVPGLPPFPHQNTPAAWQQWAQQFRQSRHGWQHHGRGWAWNKNPQGQHPEHHAYVGHAYQAQQQQPQAVILTSMIGDTLHLDAHGFAPNEQVTVDLNIPMSRVSKSTPSMADATGHLAHDYKLSKPPGKQYIAALRVTGMNSRRVGFKSVQI